MTVDQMKPTKVKNSMQLHSVARFTDIYLHAKMEEDLNNITKVTTHAIKPQDGCGVICLFGLNKTQPIQYFLYRLEDKHIYPI